MVKKKNMPSMQGTQVRSLGQEDLLEKVLTYSLQYSCLENSMDRGAWQATVHEDSKQLDSCKQLDTANHLTLLLQLY